MIEQLTPLSEQVDGVLEKPESEIIEGSPEWVADQLKMIADVRAKIVEKTEAEFNKEFPHPPYTVVLEFPHTDIQPIIKEYEDELSTIIKLRQKSLEPDVRDAIINSHYLKLAKLFTADYIIVIVEDSFDGSRETVAIKKMT